MLPWCCRGAIAGGRPASLAALLLEAPQCVPFDQRVLIFRSLVAADKDRYAAASCLTSGFVNLVSSSISQSTFVSQDHGQWLRLSEFTAQEVVQQAGRMTFQADHCGMLQG
jgi:hypothetical protein